MGNIGREIQILRKKKKKATSLYKELRSHHFVLTNKKTMTERRVNVFVIHKELKNKQTNNNNKKKKQRKPLTPRYDRQKDEC